MRWFETDSLELFRELQRPFNALAYLEFDLLVASYLGPQSLWDLDKQILDAEGLSHHHCLLDVLFGKDYL